MPPSLLLSPEGFIVIPTSSRRAVRRPHTYYMYGLFASLGHARLTAIKSAFGLDIILVYTPLSNLDHGSQTSTQFVFKKPTYKKYFFGFIKFCIPKSPTRNKINKMILSFIVTV